MSPWDRLRHGLVGQPGLRRVGKAVATTAADIAVPARLQLAGLDATRAARTRVQCADVFDYPSPPDPFAVRWVDPADIRRFSPRIHPPWWGRRRAFGDVRPGEWDRRSYAAAPRAEGYPHRGERQWLYADRVDDSPLYVAIRDRLDRGVDWTDTAYVRAVLDWIESGTPVWQDCRTRGDVLERCDVVDALAESVRENGVRTQRELVAEGVVARAGILHALSNEIVVDVGRDGELLLVSGKHRFAIARTLGLETVPVATCVRHEQWLHDAGRSDNNG